MTNKEKLQLLLEGKCKWCKKPSNLGVNIGVYDTTITNHSMDFIF